MKTLDDPVESCHRRGWTDGLPVVPPTAERVRRMLGAWADRGHDVVAVLPPSGGVATREKIAANAVMAGCLPEHLPVVEAAVRAAAQPAFNLDRVMTTASSQAPVLVVNGPIANRIGLSGDREALGSAGRANATIGRAVMLTLRNVASHRAGGMEHATLGNPGRFGVCLTENAALSPWPSWHADRGLDPDASWVSLYPGEPPLVLAEMGHHEPDHLVRTIAECISIPATYTAFFREDLWLVLSPQHARLLAEHGWSRADFVERLHRAAGLPAERLRGRGLYGYLDELVPPHWLDTPNPVPLVDDASRLVVLVAGGEFGGYTAVMFGEGTTVTERIGEPA